jgi:PAS domain S-box-containing protein
VYGHQDIPPYHQPDYEEKRKARLINLMTIFSLIYLAGYAVATAILHRYMVTAVVLFFIVVGTANIIIFRIKRNIPLAGNVILASTFVLVGFFFYGGGIDNSGFIWMFFLAPMAFYLQGLRAGLIWTGSLLVAGIVIYLLSLAGFTTRYFSSSFITIIFSAYVLYMLFIMLYEIVRQKYQSDLRKSEEKYHSIFENALEGIYQSTVEGRYLSVNPAFARMFGFAKPEEMINSVTDIAAQIYKYPEEREKLKNIIMQQGIIKNHEVERLSKDGKIIWQLLNAHLVRDHKGNILMIEGTCIDITERKHAEYTLRETSERYKTIIENIEDGYYEVDLQGNMKFCNSSLIKMLGFSSNELMGINNRLYMDEENAKKVFATFNKVYCTSVPVKTLDWELIRKNKEKIFVETSVSLTHDSKGNISGFRGIIRDVTERNNAEKNRKRLENRLHRAEKMEAMGTMAGGVAHDLNNVLGVLVGYSELLLMEIPAGNPLRKYVANILQSGQRGAAIVQDLLTLARRGVTVLEVINLNNVVSGFFQTPEFDKLKEYHPQVVFKIVLEDDLLSVKGSPVHMEKTIMNLLSNAAESIISDGEVVVQTRNIYLDEPIHGYADIRQGDYIELSVSDNGKGIASTDLARIFEPFYTKKVMGRSGTGLGLTVVWGTVIDHGGYIDVQSEEGKGSVFTLFLPVTREEQVKNIQHEPPDLLMGSGESILVIDDIKEQRELAANMLSRLGYKVDMVASGEEALDYLKTHKADLVLLDMIMDPGMDGLETYQQILKINPKQKAIIVSGFSETDRISEAQKIGAGAYLKKPYLLEKIGRAVKNELTKDVVES